jgi:hypothetical protein
LFIRTLKVLDMIKAIRGHPNRGLRCLGSMIARMISGDGPLGLGLPFQGDE